MTRRKLVVLLLSLALMACVSVAAGVSNMRSSSSQAAANIAALSPDGAQLEPLFVRYGVAAAFSGHDHVYERIKPQQDVQYFVSGAGGQLRRGNLDRSQAFFAAGNDEVNSFMYVEVTRDQLAFRAVDAKGLILDSGSFGPPSPSSAARP